MEPQQLITAKLVLGYLRSEKCKTAYKEFLKTYPSFRHLDYAKTKYMPTRFLGQSLADILAEYFEISQIIQGRLEATNYYNEDNSKTSLVEQLFYLLNKVPASSSSIISTPHGSNVDYSSPDHSDVEATPVHALPGNVENETFESRISPKRKTSEKYGKSSSTVSSVHKNKAQVFDTELLAQNLMEDTAFQKKMCHTLNKVVDLHCEEMDFQRLDHSVKTAIEKAEADPVFEELLGDIIGSSNLEVNSVAVTDSGTTNLKEKRTDIGSSNTNKSYSKSSQIEQPVEAETPIDNSANQMTIVTEELQNTKELPQGPVNILQHVISYDSFSNYNVANDCNLVSRTQCFQNPLYINTMTGLLIPTNPNPTKPLVLLNNAPTVLSEQDIMKMPIILKDNKDVAFPSGTETEIHGQASGRTNKQILPKPTIKIAPEASNAVKDFFKNFVALEDEPTTFNDENTPITSNEDILNSDKNATVISTNETAVCNKPVGLKKVIYPKASKKSPKATKQAILSLKIIKNKSKPNQLDVGDDATSNTTEDVVEVPPLPEQLNTPLPAGPVKKPTPKSGGSHVRNLNFSSPLHKMEARRKSSSPSGSKSATAKSLFKPVVERKTPWDAALRAAIPISEEDLLSSKQPTCGKKTRKKTKSQLNTTTEKEGMLLEAAIATPLKSYQNDNAVEENEPENQSRSTTVAKTVLSPSKLSNISKNILDAKSGEEDATGKFVTPDMSKQHNSTQPIKAARNIARMLETPVKMGIPKTPGISTPLDISTTTPFTKMLEANLDLKGMDINSLPTPNLPITPNFPPFTPTVELISPYSNRPTDYSTGSSYYQPSDNEQNKNLEAHLREMEKEPVKDEKEPIKIDDRLQCFNKNVIGKKNLNLMRKSFNNDGSSDDSTSAEEEEDSLIDWHDKETNDTVILKKVETPKRVYSLRNRSTVSTTEKPATPKKKQGVGKISKKPTKETKKATPKGKSIKNLEPKIELNKNSEQIEARAEGVANEAEPNTVAAKDKGVTADKDKSATAAKDKGVTTAKDKGVTAAKDKGVTTDKDKSVKADKDKSVTTTKDKGATGTKDKVVTTAKDKGVTADKDKSVMTTKYKGATGTKDKVVTTAKDNSVTADKDQSVTTAKDKGATATKDKGVTADKDKSATASKDKGVTADKDKSVSANKGKHVTADKDKSVSANKGKHVTADKDKGVTATKDKCATAAKNKSVTAAKDKGVTAAKDKGVTAAQWTVLNDLEKKRLRMVDSLKPITEHQTSKKQPNGKFKIKPIANVFTTKKTRKSDSPKKKRRSKQLETVLNDLITSDDSDIDLSSLTNCDDEKIEKTDKTASDVEAQTLIEGLKERGIHLMHNKSPKKKGAEGTGKEVIVNTSSTLLDTFDRETFDVVYYGEEDVNIIYDGDEQPREKKKVSTLEENQQIAYIGKLYLESIGKEIEVHLKRTNFDSLIDIESDDVPKQNRTHKEKILETDDANGRFNVKEKRSLDVEEKLPENKIKMNKRIRKVTVDDAASEKKKQKKKPTGATPKKKIKTNQTAENKKQTLESKIEFIKGNADARQKKKADETKGNKNTISGIETAATTVTKEALKSTNKNNNENTDHAEKKSASAFRKTPHRSSFDKETEEDLMNFAITGRDASIASASSAKKRKLPDEDNSENSCKKMLKSLDLDSFLNKIHSDAPFKK